MQEMWMEISEITHCLLLFAPLRFSLKKEILELKHGLAVHMKYSVLKLPHSNLYGVYRDISKQW